MARVHEDVVYVVNRLGGDNVQALDPAQGFATRWQCSVGNGATPHDIAFAARDKAYVTLYEEPELLVVDPSVGPALSANQLMIQSSRNTTKLAAPATI